jgi:hypothetical protein
LTIIQTTVIQKVTFRGTETLKRGRGNTPKMAGKSAGRKANYGIVYVKSMLGKYRRGLLHAFISSSDFECLSDLQMMTNWQQRQV